jgi:hypothetical protein
LSRACGSREIYYRTHGLESQQVIVREADESEIAQRFSAGIT